MTAADRLLADLRAKSDAAKAAYVQSRDENHPLHVQSKLIREWAEAVARIDGAQLMMRAIIADEVRA